MARLSRSPALFIEEQTQAPPPTSRGESAKQLWVAVYLTDLALRAVADADLEAPVAVVEPIESQLRVVAVNARARRLGVNTGLTVGAALALTDSLELLERSVVAERAGLESLADWADELTPVVSLEAPATLLLEVRGSLRLFSGLENVKRRLAAELERRRLGFRLGTAPTPLAAQWLARYESIDVLEAGELTSRLAALPLSVTGWPGRIELRLQQMGVRTIGACLRLPRAGFARRIGKSYLDDLDRALGRQPDLRPRFEAPRSLSWAIDFTAETSDRQAFTRAIEAGIAYMASDLRARQSRVGEIEIALHHSCGARTTSVVRFVEPVHEKHRLLDPLVSRLERIELGRPVVALGLGTGPLQPMHLDAPRLFGNEHTEHADDFALVECLRGRFGQDCVHGIELEREHRPELAWSKSAGKAGLPHPGTGVAELSPWACERPLWILPTPRFLAEGSEDAACLRSARTGPRRTWLESEAERIESGWWDGLDVRRDYYAVLTVHGEKWWVYQDCRTRRWYLHGIFG